MLTGHKPVGVFPVVSKRNPLAGVAVDRVLSRALQQDADERYATLAEFTGELESALGSAAPRQRMVIPAVVTTVLLTLIIAGSMFLAGRGEAGRGGDRPVGAAEAEATGTGTGAGAGAGAGATAAGEAVESADFVAVVPFDTKRAQSVQFRWAKRLGREVSELNSLGMTLWLIPVGEFMMGSSRESIDSLALDARQRQAANYVVARLESELPRHRVRLTGPFDMSSTEVTVAQFREFIESSGYRTDIERSGRGYGRSESKWQRDPRFHWANLGTLVQEDSWPVVNISYYDAQTFCRWLSEREGSRYRLPSEAEWEFACRAGSALSWSSGAGDASLTEYAVHGPGMPSMLSVGTLLPNAFGLFDTSGNVWEWCRDWFAADYYSRSPDANPPGPRQGERRVVRGGSFANLASYQRCAARQGELPDRGRQSIGFRVVREIAIGDSAD
jgi:formylglycine-generating enzyme required for sulfatase activity